MSVAELELEVNSGVGGLTISGSSIQSHTLDLSRKGITQLPDELPHSSNLQVSLQNTFIDYGIASSYNITEPILRRKSTDRATRISILQLSTHQMA